MYVCNAQYRFQVSIRPITHPDVFVCVYVFAGAFVRVFVYVRVRVRERGGEAQYPPELSCIQMCVCVFT